jgi:regulator of sigma E protease
MSSLQFLKKARIALLVVALLIVTLRFGPAQGWHFFLNILDFIFVITVIVFIHEFGHYIIAKKAGVKIEVFSIGFGKEIFGWTDKSGTRWKIASLPLGGYVRMYGDATEASTPAESIAELSPEEKAKTFHYKPLYKKAAIVAAGPIANFILTIAILTFFIATSGFPSTEPIVGEVMKDTPAEAAGLRAGDKVLAVNDRKIDIFMDIPRAIMTNLGTPVTLDILRDNKELHVTLTPKQMVDKDGLGNNTRPVIGIMSQKLKYENIGLARSLWEATRETYYMCVINLEAIGQLIQGKRSAKESITGPIGIAKLSGQAAQKGLSSVFLFIANLSVSLGLINLFPVPMLDGGHLLYYAIEAVQGRPLAKRFQEYGFRIGMAMIGMLMAFAILNDIRKHLFS